MFTIRITAPCSCLGDILLHGHTHIPAWRPFGAEGRLLYLNPGSVSLPKAGSAHAYMMLDIDTGTVTWHDMDGCVFHRLAFEVR